MVMSAGNAYWRCVVVLALTLFSTVVVDIRVSAADPAGRTPRVVALTCCERSEEAWGILSAWHRSCAKAALHSPAAVDKYIAMLSLQSRSTVPATAVTAVCKSASLTRSAIAAYFRYAFCTSLPRTHADLARSVYSPLMDEAPALEDELTDNIEAACRGLQDRWVADTEAWAQQLRSQTALSTAQALLCPRPCRWREDFIDGATYDL
jgi:hypothetical protein